MRPYVPRPEERVKFKSLDLYQDAKLHAWSWLKVLAVHGDMVSCQTTELSSVGWSGTVPLTWIEPPLGWQPTYRIVVTDREQAEKVHGWFSRGIVVWVNQALDSSGVGGYAFSPVTAGEVATPPHWQYGKEPLDTVLADACADVFEIWIRESWDLTTDHLPPPRQKVKRAKAIADLRAEGWTVVLPKQSDPYAYRETCFYSGRAPNN